MALQIKNLSYEYENKKVFKNLNFIFEKNVTLIRGPSGCGKSTFLKLIAGHLKKQSGDVVAQEASTHQKLTIGYLHQDCHLINQWSIEENFLLVNSDKNIFSELMQQLGLNNDIKSLVSNLSGGEKQRISLIRILLQNPDIILLDEPTAHLDDLHTASVLKVIKQKLKNKIVLVVSHDNRISEFADNIFDWHKENNI